MRREIRNFFIGFAIGVVVYLGCSTIGDPMPPPAGTWIDLAVGAALAGFTFGPVVAFLGELGKKAD